MRVEGLEQREISFIRMETELLNLDHFRIRLTHAQLIAAHGQLLITERLLTHGSQKARSNMTVNLNGKNSSAQIVSRSVARDHSEQVFYPRAVGNTECRAHVQCDSIIMDKAKIRSIPEITANDANAQIVHEAAIGRINNDQLLKLMTFGLTEEEAEEVIVSGFLK